ncbi:MAG TPA: hypothetical protein G4O03_06900 [Dehalococcoidia bacterium]|nr:hypothetical protein [Dehalococcoidia bacterium]
MRILRREDIREAISMGTAIQIVKEAFVALFKGTAIVPQRIMICPEDRPGSFILFMPAYQQGWDEVGLKIVGLYPENPSRGLPLIAGFMAVTDARSGKPLAVMDGTYLTAVRTGAICGVATDLLANADAKMVAIFGCGLEGRSHLEAVCQVRRIEKVKVYDIRAEAATALAQEMKGQGRIPQQIEVAASPREAVRDADIVVTVTNATSPVFDGGDLKAGAYIHATGAGTREMREIDEATVQKSKIVIESPEVFKAGDLAIPLEMGLITKDGIHAQLAEVILGEKRGRENPQETIFFKSVGNAIFDLAVARHVLKEAEGRGLGIEAEM